MVILMYINLNSIGDVAVSTLASSVEDLGLEQPRSCLTKYFKIGICCFSTKHVSCGVSVNFIRIGDVIISTFTSSVEDRGNEHRSCLNKYYKMCICCFSAKHAARNIKNKEQRSESR